MDILLSNKEFKSESSLKSYSACDVANIVLPSGDPRVDMIWGNSLKYSLVIINPEMKYGSIKQTVRFYRCNNCGRHDKDNKVYIQINYWESEIIYIQEKRDILIESYKLCNNI